MDMLHSLMVTHLIIKCEAAGIRTVFSTFLFTTSMQVVLFLSDLAIQHMSKRSFNEARFE